MAAQTNSEDRFVLETVNRHVAQIAKLEASQEHMATQADIESLRVDMEKLKSDLTWRIVIAMSIMTAVFTAIVRVSPPVA
ncbi:MAG: hypothetical protein J4G18_15490 [Anaerolineae bacterium]|nr:hypothetical protein [Anaerolineae bacterium]